MGTEPKLSADERRKLEQLEKKFTDNNADVYVLDPRDLAQLWVADRTSKGAKLEAAESELRGKLTEWKLEDLWSYVSGTAELTAKYTALALDVTLLQKLAADLGKSGSLLTKYRISGYSGRRYIIFKGNHRARQLVRGTRYLAQNTKLIDLGVGRLGAARAVASGVRITIVLTVAFRAVDTLMRDEAMWHDFVGATATDVVKAAAAGGAAFAAGAWVAGGAAAGAIAVGPLFAVIVVGFAVGLALDYVDDRTGFTEKLIEGLRAAEASFDQTVDRIVWEWNWHHRSPYATVQFWMRVFGAPY